jgi:HlyD family secretion protein
MTRKRIFIIIGIVAALLLLFTWIFGGKKSELRVSTEKASRRTITELVSASGKIQPETEVKISADVSGQIIDLYVAEGDSVVQGQLLLRINPELYLTNVDQLQASLDNARSAFANAQALATRSQAALRQAENIFKRQQGLYQQRVISQQDFETAESQYQMAQADAESSVKNVQASGFSVKSFQARLDEGRKNLGRTSIYAPVSGIVSQLNSKKGERVVGTAQMAGTEIMRVADLRTMEVQVDVNENDIIRIHNGDSAQVKIDAFPDKVFRGVVTEIANSAKFNAAQVMSDQVTNYTVKVRILRDSYKDLLMLKDHPFRPGMTATVDIETETAPNALCVPISSVTTRNPADDDNEQGSVNSGEKATWVFKYVQGKAVAVKVKTGLQDTEYFQITEGIKEGDELITAPGLLISKTLRDGNKVVKSDRSKLFEKQ